MDATDLLGGNIDAAMADGIENADIFVVFLTADYIQKVHTALRSSSTLDNCAKEWRCAVARNKRILPVVLEEELLQTAMWPPGAVTLHLAGTLYVDGTDVLTLCDRIHTMLLAFGETPQSCPPRALPVLLASRDQKSSNRRLLPSLPSVPKPVRSLSLPPLPGACLANSSDPVTPRHSCGCSLLPRRLSRRRQRSAMTM